MSHREFQDARDSLFASGLIFQKSINLTDTLIEMDMVYPFSDGAITLDGISGSDNKVIWKEMNRMAKKLSAKLTDKVHADDNEFAMHYSFKVLGQGKGEAVKYLPFTLEFNDGQVLTALVKNIQNVKTFQMKKEMMVTHFMLNKQDITEAIYINGNTNIDTAETVRKLVRVIEGSHTKFVSKNPMPKGTHKEAVKLREEIGAMVVDLSGVVGENNDAQAMNDKFDKMMAEKSTVVNFNSREEADAFATAWSRATSRGHSVGEKSVTVSDVTDEEKSWIDNYVSSMKKEDPTSITQKDLDELNEGFDNPPKVVKKVAPTYTVNLPSGTEKYISIIREEFSKDEKLSGMTYSFVIDGTVMDSIDKKSVAVEGGEKAIQTHMKKIIHFITIGADKIEGKENGRMPSVDLIRNAEYIKEKTGLEYAINHHQRATFETAREQFEVGENGRGYSLYRAIGRHAHESTKERWLMSDASRKRIIENINEELVKDKQKEDTDAEPIGFVNKILSKPHTISEDGKVLTAEDGKRYHITEDYHGEEGITDLALIENDVEITDENIAEHYPTMTSFQKNENQDALDSIISARAEQIAGELGFTDPKMWLLYVDYEKSEHDSNVIGQTVFGVKDNLHSLDRYIADIKASDEYKTYIENTTPKTEEPKTLSIKAKLKIIKPFMGKSQYKVISTGMDKEDYEFNDVIDRLHKTISTMPKSYETDGQGDKAVARLHYFNSGSDWYITEKDQGDEQVQAFGYAILNGDTQNAELGYVSIEELTRLGVELDFHWSEKTLGEVKAKEDVGETVDMENDGDKELKEIEAELKQLDKSGYQGDSHFYGIEGDTFRVDHRKAWETKQGDLWSDVEDVLNKYKNIEMTDNDYGKMTISIRKSKELPKVEKKKEKKHPAFYIEGKKLFLEKVITVLEAEGYLIGEHYSRQKEYEVLVVEEGKVMPSFGGDSSKYTRQYAENKTEEYMKKINQDKTYAEKIEAMEERKGQSIEEMVGDALKSTDIAGLNKMYEEISSQFPDNPDSDTDPILKKIIELETEPKGDEKLYDMTKVKEALSIILEAEDNDILMTNVEIVQEAYDSDPENNELIDINKQVSDRIDFLVGV